MKKTLKKCISLLLVFGMIFVLSESFFNLEASAADYSGTCGENLVWSLDTVTGEFIISGTGDMTDWSDYSDVPWDSCRSSIKSVTIGNAVTSIGNRSFYNCSELESLTIGEAVKSIGYAAFYNCDKIDSINIPDSVTDIEASAFASCDGAKNVTIGNSVERIGEDAFCNCDSITSVSIPASVKSVGAFSFGGGNIGSITADENNAYFSNDEYGVLFNKDKTELLQYPTGNSRTKYTVPNSVEAINAYAFYGSDCLTEITIGSEVASIGYYAFYDCRNLADVYYEGTKDSWDKITIGYGNDKLSVVAVNFKIIINMTSDEKAEYKSETIVSLSVENLPENSEIIWTASGAKVTLTPSDDGKSCKIEFLEKGDVTVTATTIDITGEENCVSSTIMVEYTWWQWIIIIIFFGWIWY